MTNNNFEKVPSTIAIETSKGVYAIHVYYDGTFEKMGKKLLAHYSKHYSLPLQITNKGTVVYLGNNLRKYDDDTNVDGTLDLTAYNKEKEPKTVYKTIADLVQTESKSDYIYLWIKDRWYGMKVEDKKPYLGFFMELKALV